MAAKPKLTPEQWSKVRKTWEADPRKPLAWLIEELALPVSDEALRLRAKSEGWAKSTEPKSKHKLGKAPKASKVKPKLGKSPKSKLKAAVTSLGNDDDGTDGAQDALSDSEHESEARLTPNEDRFVLEYLIDLNATQAYLRVFPKVTVKSASVLAARLLGKVRVSEKVEKLKKERLDRLSIDGDKVVEEAYLVGMADMRELVEYRYTCCRYCYGEGFKFQRSQGERDRDFDKHEAAQDEREFKADLVGKAYTRKEFDEKGGTGYLAHKPPNPECIECGGVGVGGVRINDTSKLSRGAVALYAGVKEGKDGIEIKAHGKLDGLEKMFKNLGKYELDNEQKETGTKLSPAEMAKMYLDARAEADLNRLAMIKRRKQFEADDAKEAGGR